MGVTWQDYLCEDNVDSEPLISKETDVSTKAEEIKKDEKQIERDFENRVSTIKETKVKVIQTDKDGKLLIPISGNGNTILKLPDYKKIKNIKEKTTWPPSRPRCGWSNSYCRDGNIIKVVKIVTPSLLTNEASKKKYINKELESIELNLDLENNTDIHLKGTTFTVVDNSIDSTRSTYLLKLSIEYSDVPSTNPKKPSLNRNGFVQFIIPALLGDHVYINGRVVDEDTVYCEDTNGFKNVLKNFVEFVKKVVHN